MNWTLLAVGIILLVCALVGCKRGLVKVLFSMLALVVVLVVTSVCAPKLAPAIREHTGWDEKLSSTVEEYLDENGILVQTASEQEDSPSDAGTDDGTDSDEQESGDSLLLLPLSVRNEIEEKSSEYIEKGVDAYNAFVVSTVSESVFSILVYVGLFLAVGLVVLILWIILNVLSKLPGIKEANRLGGFLIGLIGGLVIVWVLMAGVTIFTNSGAGSVIAEEINRNFFLTFLYERNPLLFLITKLI